MLDQPKNIVSVILEGGQLRRAHAGYQGGKDSVWMGGTGGWKEG